MSDSSPLVKSAGLFCVINGVLDMDKSLINLIDTCITVGVASDHIRRLSEICYECKDILCEILGDEKL